jgi:hypothetical protein
MQPCRELALRFAWVGNPQIIAAGKGFEATRGWTFCDSWQEGQSQIG